MSQPAADTHAVLSAAAAAHRTRTPHVHGSVHDVVAAIASAAATLNPTHARAMIDDRAATHPDPRVREHLSAILRELYQLQHHAIVEVRP
jgi:hypothetical protein